MTYTGSYTEDLGQHECTKDHVVWFGTDAHGNTHCVIWCDPISYDMIISSEHCVYTEKSAKDHVVWFGIHNTTVHSAG
jgi:hypothetical protein